MCLTSEFIPGIKLQNVRHRRVLWAYVITGRSRHSSVFNRLHYKSGTGSSERTVTGFSRDLLRRILSDSCVLPLQLDARAARPVLEDPATVLTYADEIFIRPCVLSSDLSFFTASKQTRSSLAVAEGPCDAPSQLKPCEMLHKIMFVESHLNSLAIGEWPSRSFKVTGNGTNL